MNEIFMPPQISICIVNLNGRDYLKNCIESLRSLDYPKDKIEVIVVDNGSKDDSLLMLASDFSEVKIIKNSGNAGFAKANNQAARQAQGEYIAFLNNDTKVDSSWLIELLKPIFGSKETVCSGSKVLSFDGKSIDFAGAMINFEGKGFQVDYGVSIEKDIHNIKRYLPFVNGGAMLVKKDVFLASGGFDEDFFAYYEDVDFGWRLWVLGYKVVFAPKSIVYHMHHGTSKNFSEDKLRFLKERNSLISVFKNYDDENLARMLSATLASVFSRVFVDFKFDYKNYYNFDLNDARKAELSKKLKDEIKSLSIGAEPLSSLMAVKDFLDNIGLHREKREKIQKQRARDDKAVFTYFKGQFFSVTGDENYCKTQIELLKSLGIYESFEKKIKRTILIISDEPVAKEMAGPAIRAFNFSKVLARHMNVILACPNKPDLPDMEFALTQYSDDLSVKNLAQKADIILCQGTAFNKFKSLKISNKFLILDIYDPYNLATLEEYSHKPISERINIHNDVLKTINEQLYYGDFFICASERQRDFWLGMLSALSRVNPITYYADSSLRKTIDVVSFGIEDSKPVHTKNVLKGVVKGIEKDDFVVLWGGGIYNWFDPLSLVKAMKIIDGQKTDTSGRIKLFFMGVKHPNPMVKEVSLINETVDLAKSLNIYEKNVFFNFGWVAYDERQNYLLESDVGIITHPVHIETRFSFRTRVLDYIWAGLPIVSTEGDFFSEIIEKENLGAVVKQKDPESIAAAIMRLASDENFRKQCKSNLEKTADMYTWEKVCKPLIDFCEDPVISAKKDLDETDGQSNSSDTKKNSDDSTAKKFFYHLKRSGPKKTFKYVGNYLKGR